MTIKTEYANGTLTTYPNQYRFVSGEEDVRIFRGTPLHILDYEIKKGTPASELVKLGEQFKWNSMYLLRYNNGRLQWGSPSKKTRITFASTVAEEDSEKIIKYLEGKYVAFNSYSEENFEWLKAHLNEIKRDLRDTFNLRIKIIEEKEEGAVAGDVQSTFHIDNSAELEELKQKYIALKKQRISLQKENNEIRHRNAKRILNLQKENNELRKKIQTINRKDDRYSEIFEMYLLESGSLRCPRCQHQLKLRVTKKGRHKGVIFFGCEDYQYNSHSDCRFRKEIDGVTYAMHQRMIDSFLNKPHYDFDGNLIENVRLPLPSEYYQKYLKGMMDDGS